MSKGTVTGVERVLDIFEAFREQKSPLSMSELADATGIPKSTCHAILATLQARGYMYTLNRPKAHYPTRRLFAVASDILRHDRFVARATPLMEQLREVTGETLILGKRQGDRAVYLQVLEGPHSIRYSAQIGDLKPLHSSAIGKALLGSMRDADLSAQAERLDLVQVTPNSLIDRDALVADVRAGRKRGFYQTRGENVGDVWAVAAPVTAGADLFAIAIAGPANRMQVLPEEQVHLLIGACAALSKMADT